MNDLENIARSLVVPGKGILAGDESTSTINGAARYGRYSEETEQEKEPLPQPGIITMAT